MEWEVFLTYLQFLNIPITRILHTPCCPPTRLSHTSHIYCVSDIYHPHWHAHIHACADDFIPGVKKRNIFLMYVSLNRYRNPLFKILVAILEGDVQKKNSREMRFFPCFQDQVLSSNLVPTDLSARSTHKNNTVSFPSRFALLHFWNTSWSFLRHFPRARVSLSLLPKSLSRLFPARFVRRTIFLLELVGNSNEAVLFPPTNFPVHPFSSLCYYTRSSIFLMFIGNLV